MMTDRITEAELAQMKAETLRDGSSPARELRLIREVEELHRQLASLERRPEEEWHSSYEDSGPDVGIAFKISEKAHVWCGEISRRTFEKAGFDFDTEDSGYFIALFDERLPRGEQIVVYAKAADQERGNAAARLIARALIIHDALVDEKGPPDGGPVIPQ